MEGITGAAAAHEDQDVVIIGGGSAGLSAALMLGRSRRRVLVVDEGAPRNRFAGHMHGVLGRDHTSPLALLADGRAELARYEGVRIVDGSVVGAAIDGDGLRVELADGTAVHARRLLVAGGLRDVLPAVDGLEPLWGRGVFVCPYCDGWEVRDRRIAVLSGATGNPHQAQLMRQLSPDVTFFTNGVVLDDEVRAGLAARGIRVDDRTVAASVADASGSFAGLRLADGAAADFDALVVAPVPEPADAVLRALGATRAPHPMGGEFAVVDPMGRTSVPGVWAAGNVVDPRSSVPFAMAAGSMAGAAINADLVEEDVRLARRAA